MEAKQYANQQGEGSNWIEVLSYYQELGGYNVEIYCYLDERDIRRLIVPLDNTDEVLMLNDKSKEERFTVLPYEEVFTSKKEFIFNYDINPTEVILPDEHTFLGDRTITINYS